MSLKSLQDKMIACNSLDCVVLELQCYFLENNINGLKNSQQQKSIIADTAYFYLGCKPPFSLGELYLRLKIDKAFLTT
jgi:hypothetical protein